MKHGLEFLICDKRNDRLKTKMVRINLPVLIFLGTLALVFLSFIVIGAYYSFNTVSAKIAYNSEVRKNQDLLYSFERINEQATKKTELISRFADLENNLSMSTGVAPTHHDIIQQSVGGRLLLSDKITQLLGSYLEIQAGIIEDKIYAHQRQLNFLEHRLVNLNETAERQRIFLAERPSITPMRGRVSSEFGSRNHPILNRETFHEGIDIVNAMWTPIVAAADGIVSFSGTRGGFGIMVDITHRNSGYLTRYAHLAATAVNVGDVVRRGDIIGYMGNTGRSTGPHLHFEVRRGGRALNPRSFMLDANQMLTRRR